MPRVAIVLRRDDSLDKRAYWLRAIAECWRAGGIEVSVINDPLARIEADLAILHVNLTVVPPEYLACVRSSATTVNGDVSDISKRVVSSHLLHREDRYGGPVIVKTNRNDKGIQELQYARKGLGSLLRPRDAARSYLDYFREEFRRTRRWQRYGSRKAFLNYPVFDSMAAVPAAVWGDDDYVVERFLPEMRDGRYCVRTWLFFGDGERHALFFSDHPVVKSRSIKGYEPLTEVPEELRQMRRDLKFDFGKFDYAIVDGRPILFDASRTPTIGDFPRDRYLPIAQILADGIGAFLKNPSTIDPGESIVPAGRS
jgi:hypothetical protein